MAENKNKGCGGAVLIIIVIIVFIWLFPNDCSSSSSSSSGSNSSSSSSSSSNSSSDNWIDLDVSVYDEGTQLSITNNDTFSYRNLRIEINPPSNIFKSGYVYSTSLLSSGKTIFVGYGNFTKPDGEKFNPFAYKVQKVYITCDLSSGKEGMYVGTQ